MAESDIRRRRMVGSQDPGVGVREVSAGAEDAGGGVKTPTAMGHHFGPDMRCENRPPREPERVCGRSWYEQEQEPVECEWPRFWAPRVKSEGESVDTGG